MPTRRQVLIGAAALATSSGRAAGQTAAGTHRMVVGFPPGGSADTVARLLVDQLKDHAPAWIVDNRPGAGGRIALEHLKASAPDGASMIITPASMQVLYPHVYKKLSYDPIKDFEPVGTICSSGFSLTVGPKVPATVKTLADFIAWSKANPNDSGYGTSGAGSMPHFAGVMLGKAADFEFVHVPYKGAAPAIQDLLGGHVASNISVISTALPSIQAGQLRSLATTGAKRSPFLPDVPTMTEAGFKDLTIEEWFGVFLPAKTPEAIVSKLQGSIQSALKTKALQDGLSKLAFDIGGLQGKAFGKLVADDIAKWGPIVKTSGFTPAD